MSIIKIKICKTCVYNEYEEKKKNGTGPNTTALVRGIYWGGIFPGGGNEQMSFVTISNKNIFSKFGTLNWVL